jgi:glycoprotein-N-acetylgalactosamine 3-beta-galactosyltransferase
MLVVFVFDFRSAVSDVQPQSTKIADIMTKDIRILCLVLTEYNAHNSSAQAVKNTWGKRCTTLLFVSNKVDPTLHTLVLNKANGHQWKKFKELFWEIYQYNLDVYHWFYIVNDQT